MFPGPSAAMTPIPEIRLSDYDEEQPNGKNEDGDDDCDDKGTEESAEFFNGIDVDYRNGMDVNDEFELHQEEEEEEEDGEWI